LDFREVFNLTQLRQEQVELKSLAGRYGARKAALARKLNSENIEEVQGVARRSLSSNACSATTIRPF